MNLAKQNLCVVPQGFSDDQVRREFDRVLIVENSKVVYGVYLGSIYKIIGLMEERHLSR